MKEKIRFDSIIPTIVGFGAVSSIFESTSKGFATLAAVLLPLSFVLFTALNIVNKTVVSDKGIFQIVFDTALMTFALFRWLTPSLRDIVLFAMLGRGSSLLLHRWLTRRKRAEGLEDPGRDLRDFG
jgi:hypothetical protein